MPGTPTLLTEEGNTMDQDERTKLADRIDAWSPSQGVLVFIARERRMIADALRNSGREGLEKAAKLAESYHGLDEGDLPHDIAAGNRIAKAIRMLPI